MMALTADGMSGVADAADGTGLVDARSDLLELPAGAALPTAPHEWVPPAYVPGRYIMCRHPHPAPPYHVSGWCAPDDGGTRISGPDGVIEMTLRSPERAYTLTLDVTPGEQTDRMQTLEIFFNRLRIGLFEVAAPTTLRVELPAELFTLRKTRIALHCPEAAMGTDCGPEYLHEHGIVLRGWRIG